METKANPSKKKKLLPVIFILIIIAAASFGISKYIHAMHHEDTDDAQIDGDINPVLSRVSGFVDAVRFEDNQPVKKGDTLIIVDDRDLQIKVKQAMAALDNAHSALAVATAAVEVANGNVSVAEQGVIAAKVKQTRADQDFKRFSVLIHDDATTQQKYDAAKAEKDGSDAAVAMAQSQVNVARQQAASASRQIAVAQSMINQREVDLEFAKLQLSYAAIIAPVSGLVSKKNVQPGQLINAGSPLCAIVSNESVFVIANFKETQLAKMKEGQAVEIKVDAFPDQVYEGKVYRFSAATGAKFSLLPPDNATGNFVKVIQRVPVKIKVDGKPENLNVLRPGMSVKVSVSID